MPIIVLNFQALTNIETITLIAGFSSDSRFWTFSRPGIFASHLNNLGPEAKGRLWQVREL